MAYEKRFKQRVLQYLDEGHTQRATAKVFGIGTTTLKKWKAQVLAGESLDSKVRNRKPKKTAPERLRAYVSLHPDAYLSELAAEFNCATSSIHEALVKLKITRKKRR